jgi:hypothetical protein
MIPSYANPTGKTTRAVTAANTAALKAGLAPKPTPKPTPRPTPTKTATTTPIKVSEAYEPMAIDGDPTIAGPVAVQPETTTPGTAEAAAVEEAAAPQYSVYDDPFYQQALQGAQSQFNLERANALGTRLYQERDIQRELQGRPATAEAERRRLAGNYAARGMGGGRAGVLSRAEAEVNAREITARTGLREQMAELNRQFVGQFGAEGTDWLGTLRGSQAQQSAIQAALQNRLAGLTTVG